MPKLVRRFVCGVVEGYVVLRHDVFNGVFPEAVVELRVVKGSPSGCDDGLIDSVGHRILLWLMWCVRTVFDSVEIIEVVHVIALEFFCVVPAINCWWSFMVITDELEGKWCCLFHVAAIRNEENDEETTGGVEIAYVVDVSVP